MADLVTHLCTALLPAGLITTRFTGVFALGVCLPDLAGRVPGRLLLTAAQYAGWSVPYPLIYGFTALHWPVGSTLLAYVLSRLVPPADQRATFWWLVGGMTLHQATDLLQDHHGQPDPWLYPLCNQGFELGLITTETTVFWAPWLAILTGWVWARRTPPTDET